MTSALISAMSDHLRFGLELGDERGDVCHLHTGAQLELDWSFGLSMSSAEARFFQLYSPASGGLFVAEPVSHANAALNAPEDQWPALGLRVLEAGETMSLTMRLDVITS